MDPLQAIQIANAFAQLIPQSIAAYKSLQSTNPDQIPPIEEVLSQADANWQAVANTAKQQMDVSDVT